jgi:ADP-ribosylglycohydrolase
MDASLGSDERLRRALDSLDGLSVGDAFGEQFFGVTEKVVRRIERREVPAAPWSWTDDTAMATVIVERLARDGAIDPDALARSLAARLMADPHRGYGRGAYEILTRVAAGESWRDLAPAAFGGGSFGNGAAMRAAPIGAWFADDPARAAEEARRSAVVTHAHPDGIAGAIAVAAAAALASGPRVGRAAPPQGDLLGAVAGLVPPGAVRDAIHRAATLAGASAVDAARVLGSGQKVSAVDTVPFALWCADRHLGDYVEALWSVVSGLGDRDTTAAITGGVVASRVGGEGIPAMWLECREPLSIGIGRPGRGRPA